jgi:hypothetical protein
MTRQTDELDSLIDQLNAGDEASLHETDDPELAELIGAVQRIRQLRDAATPEPDWPARAVAELTRNLRSDAPPAEDGAATREPNPAHDEGSLGPPALASIHAASDPPKRRSISRELAKMAAAIVVLVLVGGVLALVFHNQSGSDQGGIAAGGTPSAVTGAQLPLTVTANGVALQLQRVDSSSTATLFSFMIRLAPGQLGSHGFCCALGPDPSTYLTIEGITPGPGDPYGSEADGGSDPLIIRFSLQYQSPFPTDRAVILTIKRLGLPPSSGTPTGDQASTVKQIEGPWTFHITPEMVANQPKPTPFATNARFGGLSVESAQKLTGFTIVAPSPLPTVLTQGHSKDQNEFNVNGFGLGVPASVKANYVMFNYAQAFGGPVYLVETTNPDGVPRINGASATVVNPLVPGRTETLMIKTGSSSTLNIDSVEVNRFEVNDPNNTEIYYVWSMGDVHYSIHYVESPVPAQLKHVSDDDLRQMATLIIRKRAGDTDSSATTAAPAASVRGPTPSADGGYYNLTFDEAQQLTPMTLITPTYIPPSLDKNRLTIMIPPVPPVGSPEGPPTGANLSYPAKDNKGWNVDIEETSLPMNPIDAGDWAVTPTSGRISDIQIENTTIARYKVTEHDGQNEVSYYWNQGRTTMILTATIDSPATEPQIEQMIASMIEQGT